MEPGVDARAGSSGSDTRARLNRWRLTAWASASLLLLLPAAAMRFTEQLDWGPADFVVFGIMLLTACGAFEVAVRRSADPRYLAGAGVAIAAGFILVWMNLAVGLIGDEGNLANRLVGGILAVGIIGAGIARLRPAGMARAMLATATAQGLVGLIAVSPGFGGSALPSMFFMLPWLLSAWLFRSAERGHRG